jgi:membrane protein
MKKTFFKYLILNKKNILIGLLVSFIFSTIAFDDNKYYTVALLMVPSLLFSFVVGKVCYEEDSKSTKEFLLALPIKKSSIVVEKNIIGQICIFVGFVIVHIMFYLINKIFKGTDVIFSFDVVLVISIFLIVYNNIYIFLNYKFDYSKTQFASYIVFVFMLILFKFSNNFLSLINNLNTYILFLIVIAISCISIFITKNIKWDV